MGLCFASVAVLISSIASPHIFSCLDISKKCDVIWALKVASEEKVAMKTRCLPEDWMDSAVLMD